MSENKIKMEDISSRNIDGSTEEISNARVCILGAGGLGSNVAVMLARCSVGYIHIVDFDEVDVSNLNRQYYFLEDIGKKKVYAIKEIIERINPFVTVLAENIKVDEDNIAEIIKNENIIVEAFDKADMKAMVVDEVLSSYSDKIVVSGSGMAGVGDANDMVTKKISDRLFICGDGYSDFEELSGIMSPRVNICAAHQANTVIRIILDKL